VVCACIDIGSNTTRLLAAEVSGNGLVELAARRSFTRLGAGQGPGGVIPGEKVRENAVVVGEQLAAARDAGATEVCVVATAAIRRAPNRDELVDAVKRLTGVPVRVLSGGEEARLCFRGATRDLPPGDESVAVVDVGGGSVEVAVGSPGGEVAWWDSLPTGSSLLTEAHVRNTPPDEADLEALRRAAANALEDLAPPPVQDAMAVGGTATSLRLLVGGELGNADLERGVALLARTSAGAVTQQLGLDPERARLLPAGMILLQVVGKRLGRTLRLAHGGLREGAVLELARASGAGLA
jgi:exopolyphosphatase / guanosine-5'-triphosphate,3'-diphosphate pyrophosphatase